MSDFDNVSQSTNLRTQELLREAIDNAERLDVKLVQVGSAQVLDFSVGRMGTSEAGILLGQICMGGLGQVKVLEPGSDLSLDRIHVSTQSPLLACMGAQYAGWPVATETYFSMGSGPMRMPRGKEDVLLEYGLHHPTSVAIGVLEGNQLPTESVVELIASECGVATSKLGLCVARTASLPGSIQVVARSVEVAMHKLHELHFDLSTIIEASGVAPVPPIAKDDMTALGWTNDSILYGAEVELVMDTTDAAIEQIAEQVPSCSSCEFGTPFLDIFNKYDKDFYKIDKMLFSPAKIKMTNRATGNVFDVGGVRNDILQQSFGIQ